MSNIFRTYAATGLGQYIHEAPHALVKLCRPGGVLIKRLFGYSDSQVWRILQGVEFSPQRPMWRALERDEAAITLEKEALACGNKTPQHKAGP